MSAAHGICANASKVCQHGSRATAGRLSPHITILVLLWMKLPFAYVESRRISSTSTLRFIVEMSISEDNRGYDEQREERSYGFQ